MSVKLRASLSPIRVTKSGFYNFKKAKKVLDLPEELALELQIQSVGIGPHTIFIWLEISKDRKKWFRLTTLHPKSHLVFPIPFEDTEVAQPKCYLWPALVIPPYWDHARFFIETSFTDRKRYFKLSAKLWEK